MRTLPSLTGLRGVAAAWVLLFHLGGVAKVIGADWIAKIGFPAAGWVGVDLFFVLSGFLLMRTHGEDFARPTAAAVSRFAIARIVRVYPLSAAVLALVTLVVWADPSFAYWYKSDRPANLSASAFVRTALLATRWVNGDGGEWNEPVWSLSAELVGYAAFPLLAWFILRRSRAASAAIAIVCLAVLAAYELCIGGIGSEIDRASALTRMGCCFTAGIATCRARQFFGDRVIPYAAEASLAAAVLVALSCHSGQSFLFAPAAFALLVFFLSFGVGGLDRFLSSRPIMFLGRISFPLYLVHMMPLLWLAPRYHSVGLGPVAATALLLADVACCAAVATALHYLVELPSHRWAKERLRPPGLSSNAVRA